MRKQAAALFTLLALLLSACGAPNANAPTWQEQYDLGVRYLREGNYDEAIVVFTAAIEIDPKRAEAYLSLADAYAANGDTEKAIAALQSGIDATGSADLKAKLTQFDQPDEKEAGQSDESAADFADEVSEDGVAASEDQIFASGMTLSDVRINYSWKNSFDGSEMVFVTGKITAPASISGYITIGWKAPSISSDELNDLIAMFKDSSNYVDSVYAGFGMPVDIFRESQGYVIFIGLNESKDYVGHAIVYIPPLQE